MTNEYSSLKAAWHIEKISRLRDGLQIVPTHVQLIISDLCNQNCHFCAYRMDGGFSTEQFGEMKEGKLIKNPNRRIPKDKAIEILNDCADVGVKAIQFTGGGEPTVHPDHIDIFKHAKWLGLKTGLVTNGLVMRDFETLANMDWVRISLDAGTSESYENIRESKGFDKVLSNIRTLVGVGTPCVIGIGFVVTRENWEEIGKACEIAKGLGVSYIRLSAMFSEEGSGYYKGITPRIKGALRSVRELETDSFKIVDLFSHRLDDLDQGSPKHEFCGYQNFTTYIGGNLKVYRCCTTSYTLHGEVGDLTNTTFKEWLTSWEKKELYESFDARSCHHCQFHSQNEVINYLVNEPTHVDFV
ncbi:radical SAM protein [candidate division TA06 bacterium]|nr:radical SAM protein [candidate division TA06 bacterium]